MNADSPSLGRHPAPHRDKVGNLELAFGLLGAPIAWFAQLCAGSALSQWPCFPGDQRMVVPLHGFEWTGTAMNSLSVLAFVISLCAALVSSRLLRRTHGEEQGGHAHVMDVGAGRTRFLAMWGLISGAGFALATAVTAVGLFSLPRCGG